MTQKEINKKQKQLQKLWDYVAGHIDDELWIKINKAVDLELELEKECGQ